jgi:hypothetical protein
MDMPIDESDLGRVSGHSVDEDPEGGFAWTAFGPGGTSEGWAESRVAAEEAARQSELELSQPPADR